MTEQGARVTWEAAGEGERRWFVGTLATITVPGEASDGRFALIEFLVPQWASPPLHTHPQDESYVVLEGLLTVKAGSERFELGPGGAAVVPMGVPHTFMAPGIVSRFFSNMPWKMPMTTLPFRRISQPWAASPWNGTNPRCS